MTVEYRLAPEFPDPYPREDMYAALEWTASHADALGIRPDRLVVAGASAGGGLAAGMALAARDRGGPPLVGQVLDYPMLDDRGITTSMHQFDGVGVWDRVSNQTGWRALLGDTYGTEAVSPYAAPSRAGDLRGLPPAFIDVGQPRSSATRRSPTPTPCGGREATPSCTSGPVRSTRATSSRPTPRWARA